MLFKTRYFLDFLKSPKRKLLNWIDGQKTLAIQIDITNACNLRCNHCYHPHHKNDQALALTDWYEVLRQYSALLSKLALQPAVILCGGEPLVSPLLEPLLGYIRQNFPDAPVSILTNGTLISKEWADKINKFNINVQISIDGPDEQRHDQVRGKGAFARSLTGITNLQAAGIPITIQAVLSSRTSPDIEEYFAWAKRIGITRLSFTRFIGQGIGKSWENQGAIQALAPLELQAALQRIIDASRAFGIETNTDQPLYHLVDSTLGMNGKFGFQGIIVDYMGHVKVSSRADFRLGKVLDKGLENLFLHHPLMQKLRKGKVAGCGTCRFYRQCGGDRNAAYAAFGSFLKQDPGCWIA